VREFEVYAKNCQCSSQGLGLELHGQAKAIGPTRPRLGVENCVTDCSLQCFFFTLRHMHYAVPSVCPSQADQTFFIIALGVGESGLANLSAP